MSLSKLCFEDLNDEEKKYFLDIKNIVNNLSSGWSEEKIIDPEEINIFNSIDKFRKNNLFEGISFETYRDRRLLKVTKN